MGKIKDFFSEMKKEIKRIRWCKGKELRNNILITIMFIIFFALFFVLVQYLIAGLETIEWSKIIEGIMDIF